MTKRALFARNSEITRHRSPGGGYNEDMEVRRATLEAAIRLGVVFSLIAAVVAVALSAAGEVSTIGLVATVAIIGFMTSWVQTARVSRAAARRPHRSTVVSLH